MSSIADKRLILIGGHRGAGKTTLAAALALLSSRRGQRVLVVSTDSSNSLSDAFDWQIGESGAAVCAGVHALEIDMDNAVKVYLEHHAEQQKGVQQCSPSVIEAALLERVCQLIEEAEEYYDSVIFDWAPNPYTLKLLCSSKHQQGSDLAPESQGLYERCLKRFQDVDNTALLLALTPEKLAIFETQQIINGFQSESLPLHNLIVNRVLPKSAEGEFFELRRQQEQCYLQDIEQQFSNGSLLLLPLMPADIHGIAALQQTAVLLDQLGL